MHCLKDPALPLLHFNEVFAVVQASCWGCSPDDVPMPNLAICTNAATCAVPAKLSPPPLAGTEQTAHQCNPVCRPGGDTHAA